MVKRQIDQNGGMPRLDGQGTEVIAGQLSLHEVRVSLRQRVLSQADLDGNLPLGCRTDLDRVVSICDQRLRPVGQLRVVKDESKKRMGIQQQPHGV